MSIINYFEGGNQGNIYNFYFQSEKDGNCEKKRKKKKKKDKAENACVVVNEKHEQLLDCVESFNILLEKYTFNKIGNLRLEEVYAGMERYAKAERIHNCGTYLEFFMLPNGRRKLLKANFCRERLCPQCAWHRSKKAYRENKLCFDEIADKGRFIFLTVTCKNVPGSELKGEVTRYLNGFKRLMKLKSVSKYVLGKIRSLEVTYNLERDDFHPHIHCLLHVKSDYFFHGYLDQAKWRSMWEDIMDLDYNSQVDVRAFKSRTEGQDVGRELAEISKYCVKFGSFMDLEDAGFDRVITVLDDALYGRRLVEYSGTFREVRRKLKLKDDITDVQEDDLDDPVDNLDEGYKIIFEWHFGRKAYIEKFENVILTQKRG